MTLVTDTLQIDENILKQERFDHVVYIGNDVLTDETIRSYLTQWQKAQNPQEVYQFTESIYPWENVLQWHKQNGFQEFKLYSKWPDQYGYYVNPTRQIFPPSQKYWEPAPLTEVPLTE